MARAKQVSKRTRGKIALPALGAPDVFSDGGRRICNYADTNAPSLQDTAPRPLFLVRRKSPTSAWRHSISSTGKTNSQLGQGVRLAATAAVGCGGCRGAELRSTEVRRRAGRAQEQGARSGAAAELAAAAVGGCGGWSMGLRRLVRIFCGGGCRRYSRLDQVDRLASYYRECAGARSGARLPVCQIRLALAGQSVANTRTNLMTGDHENGHTQLTAKTFHSSHRISRFMCCRPMSCVSIRRTENSFFMVSSIARLHRQ